MSKTILVVDASFSFRTVVKRALRKAGPGVIEPVHGQDAAERLNAAKPNRIVCNVNMPRMDGLAFARHVKSSALHRFMLTTESQDPKKAEGRAAGVRGWIAKLFQPSMRIDAVNRLCV